MAAAISDGLSSLVTCAISVSSLPLQDWNAVSMNGEQAILSESHKVMQVRLYTAP
jgi:hypothetical protein